MAYEYRIGTYEVTIGQYTEFLNAIAADDANALYNTQMATDLVSAGISRTGAPGSYQYSVIGSPNKPVTYVTWGDAARFANWLHNGQPVGVQDPTTTEDGAYTLDGKTGNLVFGVIRNVGARWFIPNEHEWTKAAYHKNDGVSGNYWRYPTQTDEVPFSVPPPGDDAPQQSNTANYRNTDNLPNAYNNGHAVTGSTSFDFAQNYLTDVGSYVGAAGPYGTYDQAGNVWEWTETVIDNAFRGVRGGSWSTSLFSLQASSRDALPRESNVIGFRMATIPEPSALLSATLGLIAVLWWTRGKRIVRTRPFVSN